MLAFRLQQPAALVTNLLFEALLKFGCCSDLNACPVKLCCQYDMAPCCSTRHVMPDETRSAIIIMLKLLILCCSLADTDLTAVNLSTLQWQKLKQCFWALLA